MDLVGYGKSDKPEGLFEVAIKFINYLLQDIKSTQLLNHQAVNPAVMQLMTYLEYSIRNNVLLTSIQQSSYEDDDDYLVSQQLVIQ